MTHSKTKKIKLKNKTNQMSLRRKKLKIKQGNTKVPITSLYSKSIKYSKSYEPSINKYLLSFHKTSRYDIISCNTDFLQPLTIRVNNKCYPYYNQNAKQLLLHNLQANKKVDLNKIIPPKQIDSNCWFNALFLMFFVSDKGRIFFHFFRQLMIEGKFSTGKLITDFKLKNALALLNYSIDCSLTGNNIAKKLNTNLIIKSIYNLIKNSTPSITDVGQAGNPIIYYLILMNYLKVYDLNMTVLNTSIDWKTYLLNKVNVNNKYPHIVVLETYPSEANINYKPKSFTIGEATYVIDSGSIIDVNQEHFCAVLTCDGKEVVFDGYSKARILPFEWKTKLNKNIYWEFDDYIIQVKNKVEWNFTKCYSMLMYYRVN